jgi:hypothetical protein
MAEIARLVCLPVTVLHALMVLYFDQNTKTEFVLLDLDGLRFAISILTSRSAVWRQLDSVAFWHGEERVTMSNQHERD